MPYGLDLARLATSAILAGGSSAKRGRHRVSNHQGLQPGAGCAAPRGAGPRLRVASRARRRAGQGAQEVLEKDGRADSGRPRPRTIWLPSRSACLRRGLPIETARRTAGVGSLGRPRWVGIADWRGAPHRARGQGARHIGVVAAASAGGEQRAGRRDRQRPHPSDRSVVPDRGQYRRAPIVAEQP